MTATTDLVPVTKDRLKKPKKYCCVGLNDDVTNMDFVVKMIQKHFGKPKEEAYMLMRQIHEQGSAVLGIFDYEVAEDKAYAVMSEAAAKNYPFVVSVEEA